MAVNASGVNAIVSKPTARVAATERLFNPSGCLHCREMTHALTLLGGIFSPQVS